MSTVNEQILAAVQAWQSNPRVHPLTCGNNIRHRPLLAVELDDAVILQCVDCDYTQKYIPKIVLIFHANDRRR